VFNYEASRQATYGRVIAVSGVHTTLDVYILSWPDALPGANS